MSNVPVSADTVIAVGPMLFDRGRRVLTGPNDQRIFLTSAEYAAFETLVMAGGEPVDRNQISLRALHRHWTSEDRSVDQLILGLRRKLVADVDGQSLIESVRGSGYLIRAVSLTGRDGSTDERSLTDIVVPNEVTAYDGRPIEQILLSEMTMEGFDDGVLVADLRLTDVPIVYLNSAAERLTGYSRSEILGRNCRFLQGTERRQPEIAVMREAIATRRPVHVTLRNFRKDGSAFWAELRLRPILNSAGVATHYLGIMRDVSPEHDAADRAAFLAFHDEKTGLLNLRGFVRSITQFWDAALEAQEDTTLYVACLDLDRLRDVNSTYGRPAGDAVVLQAAQRLAAIPDCVATARSSDRRFFIAISTMPGAPDPVMDVDAILAAPYMPPGGSVTVTTTIGYTRSEGTPAAEEERSKQIDRLIENSIQALYQAKQFGPNSVHAFDEEAERASRRLLRLTSELRNAVREREFALFYQPKVDLASGRIVGAEALLRWHHQVFGLQAPGRFLQVAEESGMIVDIGRWAILEAARFAAALNRKRAILLPIAVNLSEVQFRRSDVPAMIESTLVDTGCRPEWLSLELTESVLADTRHRTRDALARLSGLGLELAVDDFGTGYSSLAYLRDLPFSCLKLDRSFVTKIDIDVRAQALAEAIARMGSALGMSVVAEGVERATEAATLIKMGYCIAQGYYFSMPLEQKDFEWLVGQDRPLPFRAVAPATSPSAR